MSSCLRRRLAPSISLVMAISTSSVTWRFFRSDRCMAVRYSEGGARRKTSGKRIRRLPRSFTLVRHAPEWVRLPADLVLELTSSDIAVNKRRELGFGEGADLGRLDVAVLEQHQSRDAADAVFGRRRLVLVDVQLGHFEPAGVFLRDVVEDAARSSCTDRTIRPSNRPARALRPAVLPARKCRRSRDECARSCVFSSLNLVWESPPDRTVAERLRCARMLTKKPLLWEVSPG